MSSYHQIVVGAAPGDAITQMALDIRNTLRALGDSEVFGRFIDPSMQSEVRAIATIPAGRPRDVIIYHSSFGDPEVTKILLRRPERLVIVYHNITPSELFVDSDPAFAAGLDWGRRELSLLADRVALSVADSDFNANELRELGYRNVVTIPAGARPDRLTSMTPSFEMIHRLQGATRHPYVLGVSQLLPHKRHDVLIQACHILQSVHGLKIGLVLVGALRSQSYSRALTELVRRLRVRDVLIAGQLSDSELATVYRSASVFVSASMHEGLGLPPLEAMAFGLPTIVRDAGATAETVGNGALVLPNEAGPLLFAEAIRRVHDDDELRSTLVSEGAARVTDFSATNATEVFAALLDKTGITS